MIGYNTYKIWISASLLSEQKLVNSWQNANTVSNCFNTKKLC